MRKKVAAYFLVPSFIAVVALAAVYSFFGLTAFITAALLVALEITLSFDNAVVNARVLAKMNAKWQQRFMTWGILIAVFGTRLVLPVVIVSAVVWMSPLWVAHLALFDAASYSHLLESASHSIHAFGASFLLLVGLKYFLDQKKTFHWIHIVEQHLKRWGKMDAIEIVIALLVVMGMSFLVVPSEQVGVLVAGIVGIVVFILMQGVMSAFSLEAAEASSKSIILFFYLEVLDSAFSLDGVVGAFALTSAIPVIAIGLGIGAYFVRSLTVYMVRERTLETLVFLEHGAHWAIIGLAASMFANLIIEVPEFVTGSIGLAFVFAAYWSSIRFSHRS